MDDDRPTPRELRAAEAGLFAGRDFARGPARLGRDEIRAAFAKGWTVGSIAPEGLRSPRTSGEAQAWLAVLRRP
jgi:hypothetical protein